MKIIEVRWIEVFSVTALAVLSVCSSNQVFADESAQANSWYVRIIAENSAEGLVDRGTVLGELPDSNDQYDLHDLPELEPFGAPFLTVTFDQNNWGENNGSYNSDFRKLAPRNPSLPKQWRFSVKSDDPNREVTLSWESEHRIDQMVLVDLETDEEFYAVIGGQNQTYTFNMNGKTDRDFLWKY